MTDVAKRAEARLANERGFTNREAIDLIDELEGAIRTESDPERNDHLYELQRAVGLRSFPSLVKPPARPSIVPQSPEGVSMSEMDEPIAPAEPDMNNALRIVADYQLLSEEPPRIWADLVFEPLVKDYTIHQYNVLTVGVGAFGLAYVLFEVILPFGPPFLPRMGHVETTKAAGPWINKVVGDSDVSVRWVEGVRV